MKTGKLLAIAAACLSLLVPETARAEFAVVVSPPRFELALEAGGRNTEVIGITNTSPRQEHYRMKTADWTFGANGTVTFRDALDPGSCRSWVSIESREILAPPGRRVPFRVQVDVPPDAPAQECRFALLIEGDDQLVKNPSGPNFPVAGRIGVIFYVSVGGVSPALEITPAGVREINGARLPVLQVRNTGTAHGRLSGLLSGTDAKGQELDFSPSTFPIMPGETRFLEITAATHRGDPARIDYPVVIRGQLEWGDRKLPFEQRFE